MSLRVHWETAVAAVASLTAAAMLALRAAGTRLPDPDRDPVVLLAAFGLAALLAAVFGMVAAAKLRASAPGRSLALFMSLLAIVLATAAGGPLPVPASVIAYVAFWGAVGALVLLSFRLAGVATVAELQKSRELTSLAGLVRPPQVVWLMTRRTAAWWVGLAAFVAYYALFRPERGVRPGASIEGLAMVVLFLAMATLVLLFTGAALSNVAARVSALDPRGWRATRWLLWAILTPALCFVGSSIPGLLSVFSSLGAMRWVSIALMAAAPVVLVLGVILAVIGFGAVDPSLALRRTMSIGITGMVWVAVSAIGQDVLSRSMSTAIGLPSAASWVMIIGTALVLAPLERRIERGLGKDAREAGAAEGAGGVVAPEGAREDVAKRGVTAGDTAREAGADEVAAGKVGASDIAPRESSEA